MDKPTPKLLRSLKDLNKSYKVKLRHRQTSDDCPYLMELYLYYRGKPYTKSLGISISGNKANIN